MEKNFYPTPRPLIDRMLAKVKKGNPSKVLEPSAGSGTLIDAMTDGYRSCYNKDNISAIEIDETLQATLRGKGIKVIDYDFLNFTGADKFDLIIANPPFDHGDLHLLKAIDIMYRGEIVFLLNAETIRNDYTNTRKELRRKLREFGAEVEMIKDAFLDAERQTPVEVALVYINIQRNIEDDLFAGCTDTNDVDPTVPDNFEVSTKKTIPELVAEYNQIITIGTETIVSYFRNFRKIGHYIGLDTEAKKDAYSGKSSDMTGIMQNKLNCLIANVRTAFWRRTLQLPEVKKRMTYNKRQEFEHNITDRCNMDFTEYNIRTFVLNLIDGYEQMMVDAVVKIFDLMTINHCYDEGLCTDNIHYFDGWKTNKAFKVNKKVILPVYGGYGNKGPFVDEYSGKWDLGYGVLDKINDIDIVMNYFDGLDGYLRIHDSVKYWLDKQENRNIHSTYFTITCYKKGTIHLTFNDEDVLRRFNLIACQGKQFLPFDYGKKTYTDCDQEEKDVINNFEGVDSYTKNFALPVFATRPLLQLEAA